MSSSARRGGEEGEEEEKEAEAESDTLGVLFSSFFWFWKIENENKCDV